ncbi:MAG: hypothetical protein WCT04_14075 [Planctomycetota bacterium]
MDATKMPPKTQSRHVGGSVYLLAQMIRTAADAELVSEWLIKSSNYFPALPQNELLGLRDVIAKWNSDETLEPLRTLEAVREKFEAAKRGLTAEEAAEPRVSDMVVIFNALIFAAQHQHKRNVARRRAAQAQTTAGAVTGGLEPDTRNAEYPMPSVVWKDETDRHQDPFADETEREVKAVLQKLWAEMPQEWAIVLSGLGFQIRLVDVPDSLDFLDQWFLAPDENGGVTVNTRTWCQGEGRSGDEAFPALSAAFEAVYLMEVDKDINNPTALDTSAARAI